MRLARYAGEGRVEVVDEPRPTCPPGGLLVETEACGLCSGELMAWYMDRKVPHVLGHEVAGRVAESEDARFPVGSLVFPHHHAPCGSCRACTRGAFVHCATWRATKLLPGGMAEAFGVPALNLGDTWSTDGMRAIDAALVEPVACVAKSLRRSGWVEGRGDRVAVVGLGVMGLVHMLLVPGSVGFDLNPRRVEWARALGLDARDPAEADPRWADVVVVCPGTEAALRAGLDLAAPDATVVLFAPMPPGPDTPLPLHEIYFRDLKLVNAYSCGPDDTREALGWLRAGRVRAEQVVSHFLSLDELPRAYEDMREGRILKAMVTFP